MFGFNGDMEAEEYRLPYFIISLYFKMKARGMNGKLDYFACQCLVNFKIVYMRAFYYSIS